MPEFIDRISRLEAISFDQVIETAKSLISPDMVPSAKNRVSGGIRLLNTESELNDYLVAFGEIHQAKLREFFPSVPFADLVESGLTVVDWGCGQGLATAVMLDYIHKNYPNLKVRCVWLIEIVPMALRRAQAIVGRYRPDSRQIDIASDWSFDMMEAAVERLPQDVPVLHIFSNILDVRAIDLDAVFKMVERLRCGRNTYVLSVGPDRETTTSNPERLLEFYNMFDNKKPIHVFPNGGSGRIYGDWRYWPYAYCKCYGISYALAPTSEDQSVLSHIAMPECPEPIAPPPPDPEDLFMYASAGLDEDLEASIRAGADVNARNGKGATALYFAAKHGCLSCVKCLLELGADTEIGTRTTGMTPYLIAVKYEQSEIALALAGAGCNVKARDAKGRGADDIVRVYQLGEEIADTVDRISKE